MNELTGMRKDALTAAEEYNAAARYGHAAAMVGAGKCYEAGRGTVKNISKAVELYSQAAKLGNQLALLNLSICYANGQGVRKCPLKAVLLFEDEDTWQLAAGYPVDVESPTTTQAANHCIRCMWSLEAALHKIAQVRPARLFVESWKCHARAAL